MQNIISSKNLFTNDIALYNIMLHLDINTIKQLCQDYIDAHKICHDKMFWKEKLLLDNLFIIPNMQLTMKSYENALNAITKMTEIKLQKIWKIIFEFNNFENLSFILPFLINEHIYQNQIIQLRVYDNVIFYNTFDNANDIEIIENVSYDFIMDAILKLIYYFPYQKIIIKII